MSRQLAGISSRQAQQALERLGFTEAHRKGSHATFKRPRSEGGHDVCVLTLGKSELPRHTLKSTLKQARISIEEFLTAL